MIINAVFAQQLFFANLHLNVDVGTMSPFEHGEVLVLMIVERFYSLNINLSVCLTHGGGKVKVLTRHEALTPVTVWAWGCGIDDGKGWW